MTFRMKIGLVLTILCKFEYW